MWVPINPMGQEISINRTIKYFIVAVYLLLMFCSPVFSSEAVTVNIMGQVTDLDTKMPISAVNVRVYNRAEVLAVTDSKGNYQIKNLAGDHIILLFSADNYRQKIIGIHLKEPTEFLNIELSKLEFELQEVIVTGKLNPRSDLQSRVTEKNTTSYLDIASGDLAEKTGSISVADVVQYIPGMSVTRNNIGNNDKAIIRGMEPKYSYTLINGFKIPSPDDKSRYVSLDIFPAGLLQNVQVIKTLTADLEGDAIGGATNLVMREPPDNLVFETAINTGYSERYFNHSYRTFDSHVVQDQSPYERYGPSYYATGADFTKNNLSFYNGRPLPDVTANILLGDKLLKGKLAFIAAADYKNIKNGSDGYFIPLNTQPNLNNVPAFSDFYAQSYSNNKIALTVYDNLAYRPDSRNMFKFTYLYLNQKDIETRSNTDTSLVLGRSGAGTGRIYLSDRSRVHEQVLNKFILKGNHDFGDLKVEWAVLNAAADGAYPDWSELTANTGRLISPNGTITQTPLLIAPLTRTWLSDREKDEDVFIDLQYSPAIFKKKFLTFSAGGLLRHKTRDNFYNSYVFTPEINEPFTNIYNAVWVNNNGPQDPLGDVNNANTYNATEQINAYYVMAVLREGRSEFTGGIRFEQTNQNFVSRIDPTISYGSKVNINFKDWLPDFHWKFKIKDDQQLRASYYKAISRPALYDITFSSIAYEDYNVAGNPFLCRTQADNYDLSYSWFRTDNHTLKIDLLYKHIVDAYEKTLINGNDELYPIPENGLSYTPAGVLTEQLKNTGTATNYGAEMLYSFNLYNFKVTLNYTYTSSKITRMKKFSTRETPDDPSSNEVTVTKPETGPLEGQSKNLGSFNLLYKTLNDNWFGNLSFIYNGKRIDLVSPWYGLDYWQKQHVTVNLSAGKNLDKKFKVTISAQNLFNNGLSDYIATPNPNGASGNYLPGQSTANYISVLKQNFSAYFMLGIHYFLNN